MLPELISNETRNSWALSPDNIISNKFLQTIHHTWVELVFSSFSAYNLKEYSPKHSITDAPWWISGMLILIYKKTEKHYKLYLLSKILLQINQGFFFFFFYKVGIFLHSGNNLAYQAGISWIRCLQPPYDRSLLWVFSTVSWFQCSKKAFRLQSNASPPSTGHILVSGLTLIELLVKIFLWNGFLGATITQQDS